MWIRYEALNMLTGPFAEELDAALQATYSPRDPIREFLRGKITCRQLRVLGQGLPADSVFVRARRGHAWTDTEYLLAAAVNDLRLGRAEAVAVGSGKQPRKPQLIEPPQDAPTPESEAEQERAVERKAAFEAGPLAALFPND